MIATIVMEWVHEWKKEKEEKGRRGVKTRVCVNCHF